jgi:hypothetical protein
MSSCVSDRPQIRIGYGVAKEEHRASSNADRSLAKRNAKGNIIFCEKMNFDDVIALPQPF